MDFCKIRDYIEKDEIDKAKKLINDLNKNSRNKELIELISKIAKAFINYKKNNFGEALSEFKETLTIINSDFNQIAFIESHTEKLLKENILIGIGKCYSQMGNNEDAINFLNQAKQLNVQNGEINNLLGMIHLRKNEEIQAIEFFRQNVKFYENKNLSEKEKAILANSYRMLASHDNSINSEKYLSKAVNLAKESQYPEYLSRVYGSYGDYFYKKGNWQQSLEYFEKALKLAEKEKNVVNIMKMTYNLSKVNKEMGNYSNSVEYLENYIVLFENLFNKQMTEKVAEFHSKLEFERKEQLRKQKELIETRKKLEAELFQIKKSYAEINGIGQVGIFSNKMAKIIEMADFFHSDRSVPVLIEGETGTGKEIIARIIHFGSDGFTGPFITLNCAAISPSLFESELFGYESGAFTGANIKGKKGKLELANSGTIFLDEIGELPLELQPKLLRAIQQKEIYRIGGNQKISLDIRIICATNRNLNKEVEEKRFRADLFYRLNTGHIFIPPLRERPEEIIQLANMFMTKFSIQKKRRFKYISDEAVEILKSYYWKGNVRELENVIERVVLLNNDVEIGVQHLDFLKKNCGNISKKNNIFFYEIPESGLKFKDFQNEFLDFILDKFNGNKAQAAKFLQISRTSFYRRKQ